MIYCSQFEPSDIFPSWVIMPLAASDNSTCLGPMTARGQFSKLLLAKGLSFLQQLQVTLDSPGLLPSTVPFTSKNARNQELDYRKMEVEDSI